MRKLAWLAVAAIAVMGAGTANAQETPRKGGTLRMTAPYAASFGSLDPHVHHGHVAPPPREGQGGGTTDAAARTGDHRDAVVERPHDRPPSASVGQGRACSSSCARATSNAS